MNIQQVKDDFDKEVIVSRATQVKLAEAALLMQNALQQIILVSSNADDVLLAVSVNDQVRGM